MCTAQVVREPLCYLWINEEGHWVVSREVFAYITEVPLNLNRRHRRYSSVTECLSMLESLDLIFSAI